MAIKDWFNNLFGREGKTISVNEFIGELATEVWLRELAVQSCINLIAGTLSKAEFQTFEAGQEVRKDNYYLFNVQSNKNKSAAKFWRDVVSRLVYDNHCLVVQDQAGQLYVADNFNVKRYAFFDYTLSDIEVDGVRLDRSYRQSEVLYFELHNEPIRRVIEGLYNSYSKLIEASKQLYLRRSARRGLLTVPANYPETEKAQAERRELMEKRFKKFFDAEGDAVLPLANGITYEEIEAKATAKTRANDEGQDIRSFADDILDFTAIAFQIPPKLLKGDVADTAKAMDSFLTFCISPLAELIQDEVNRKFYSKDKYLERTYLRINTSMLRAHNLKDIAGALETLLRIGGYTIDDILKTLGMEPIGNEWSTTRFLTKNYAPVETIIAGGGDD